MKAVTSVSITICTTTQHFKTTLVSGKSNLLILFSSKLSRVVVSTSQKKNKLENLLHVVIYVLIHFEITYVRHLYELWMCSIIYLRWNLIWENTQDTFIAETEFPTFQFNYRFLLYKIYNVWYGLYFWGYVFKTEKHKIYIFVDRCLFLLLAVKRVRETKNISNFGADKLFCEKE